MESSLHVAIIMDGNGRWATRRGLPRVTGHKKGVKAAKEVVDAALESNINHLTLYSFSAENWKRPQDEVNELMGLLRRHLKGDFAELYKKNIAIHFIGDRSLLPKDIVELMEALEKKQPEKIDLHLNLAISYGGRQDIVQAAKNLAVDVMNGKRSIEDFDSELFSSYLYTHNTPDPDLLIRTGAEQRISNFLLWQSAYTEFYFTDILWPNFSKKDFNDALNDFNGRDRRFGGAEIVL